MLPSNVAMQHQEPKRVGQKSFIKLKEIWANLIRLQIYDPRRTIGYRPVAHVREGIGYLPRVFCSRLSKSLPHGGISSARRIHKIMDLCVSTGCRIKALNPDDHKCGYGLPISIYSLN